VILLDLSIPYFSAYRYYQLLFLDGASIAKSWILQQMHEYAIDFVAYGLNTSTPFDMDDPSCTRYRRPASFQPQDGAPSPLLDICLSSA
jgi:hypothetical protein